MGVNFSGIKRYVTLEWPPTDNVSGTILSFYMFCLCLVSSRSRVDS